MKSFFVVVLVFILYGFSYGADANTALPERGGEITVETAIASQKNTRTFSAAPIETGVLGQIEQAGRSIGERGGSVEFYFCLPNGIFRNVSGGTAIEQLSSDDARNSVSAAAQNETALQQAPCVIVAAGSGGAAAGLRSPARDKMLFEAGQRIQNARLAAISQGLATFGTDSFDTERVKRIVRLSAQQEPLYILAAGYPAGSTAPLRVAAKIKPRALFVISGSDRPEDLFNVMDVLAAADIETAVAQIGKNRVMASKYQRQITADIQLSQAVADDYDAIVVIGGAGSTTFLRDQTLLNLIRQAAQQGKVVAAAGQTTQVLANAGVINGVRVTGEKRFLTRAGGIYTDNTVESDQGIVTAINNMQSGYFARTVIEAIKGTARGARR